MKFISQLLTFFLLSSGLHAAFTEFYAQTTGSNLNAGSSTADAALVTSTNGNWDGAAIFICGGATDLSGVSAGMFASVYNDGAAVGVYVSRITVVDDALDTITLSTTAKSGTAPTISATGRSIKIGGAWKGFNAAEGFPYGFLASTMTNSSGDVLRVNAKNGTAYAITAAMTHSLAGPVRFQGYTTTPGDGGKATIDGGTTGASYALLACSGANIDFVDLIFQNNGATGSSSGFSITGTECSVRGCVVNSVRGDGFTIGTTSVYLDACEAYGCNQNNSATKAGFTLSSAAIVCQNSISHDNTGSNSAGFFVESSGTLIGCVADTNGGNGFLVSSTVGSTLLNCDSYNNTSNGIDCTGASAARIIIRNSNFVKNGAWGITSSGSSIRNGRIINCGFGAGTQANTSGNINTNIGGIDVGGSVNYASDVTPWNAPTTGDFRITLAAAKGAGIGVFTETAASYTGTIAYPDIGSAQHLEAAGGETSSAFVK